MSIQEHSAPGNRTYIILLLLIISVVTAVVYSPVIQCGFVSFDDPVYIIDNYQIKTGITLDSLRWAVMTKLDGNWFPLTWLSYMLDISIAGESARTIHIGNVLYHLVNCSLLFTALYLLTGYVNRSACVAALFALHPLHVESVAWVSERKDLLSTLFFLLMIIAYTKYKERPVIGRYLVAFMLFICGLMSKSMLVSAPLVLLLLDYWPLKRADSFTFRAFGRLLIEKIPFVVVSVLASAITYNVQKHKAVISYAESSLLTNIQNAVYSYAMYIGKTFVPIQLAVMYPFQADLGAFRLIFAALFLVTVSTGVIVLKKERPHLLVGWFWYLITLLPVIGIVRVGKQSMADRYTYIPHIGFFILLVWGVSELQLVQKISVKIKAAITIVIVSALSVITFHQVSYWKDSISLFSRAIDVTENNWVALGVLGYEYMKLNELDKAFELLNKSITLNPKNVMALYNMGILQNKLGNGNQALHYFRKILTYESDYQMAHYQIGLHLLYNGDTAGALNEQNFLKELDPGLARQLLSDILIQNKAASAR